MADPRSFKKFAPTVSKDNSQKIIIALIIAIFVMLMTGCIVLYQVFHRPLPQFAAIQADGQMLPLTPSLEPNFMAPALLKWASRAAVAAYTFDFVNYDKETALARPYFTDAGWTAYRSAISGLIDRVIKNQLFANGVVAGPPVISNQGVLPGRGYTWRVQIPFLVTFQSAEQVKSDTYMVILTIVKVPTQINPAGIGIDQFQMI